MSRKKAKALFGWYKEKADLNFCSRNTLFKIRICISAIFPTLFVNSKLQCLCFKNSKNCFIIVSLFSDEVFKYCFPNFRYPVRLTVEGEFECISQHCNSSSEFTFSRVSCHNTRKRLGMLYLLISYIFNF